MRIKGRQRGLPGGGSVTQVVDRRVVPLLEAHRLGQDINPVAAEIAAEYARDGETLDTFMHDLGACLSAAGLPAATAKMLRAASIAWADEYSDRYNQITCVHEGSGLNSVHHLQSHVRTLLAGNHVPTSRASFGRSTQYVLLVAELPVDLVTPATMAMLKDELISRTPPGTVLSSLSSRRSVALLHRTPNLSALAGRIDRSLSTRIGTTRTSPRPRIWIEGLPHDVEAASQLVAELTR